MIIRSSKALLLSAAIALLASVQTGCAIISGQHVIEQPFTEKQVKQIRSDRTTKADILAWFGPPVALARHSGAMKVPPPGPGKRGSNDLAPELYLGLFAQKHRLTSDHIVYYYQDSSLHWSEVVFLVGPFITEPSMEVRKLWVLINERTGNVEDMLLAAPEKKTYETILSEASGTGTGPGEQPRGNSRGVNP